MTNHNPLTDPQAGDTVSYDTCERCGGCGKLPPYPWGNECSERKCHVCGGKGWCRKNKAEVVREEK